MLCMFYFIDEKNLKQTNNQISIIYTVLYNIEVLDVLGNR